ncbi:basic-leucine zipper transcription factor family protein [Striga asiatica]|uniref:Basic-leucine zipper transcription factor family protein n=1 Tax=Striga asiatica TaxID=4170 RepID=A0A5A7QYV7_STRAF|nr:basic-leucine zipper transcription factor family protein [Striga asiatica]
MLFSQKMEIKTLKQPPQPKSSSRQTAALTLDKAVEHELKNGRILDPNIDEKKLRRTISNRLSAQRSRLRKNQYINDMEKMVLDLEKLISILTPRVKSYEEKRTLLLVQNNSLQNLLELHLNGSKRSEIEVQLKQAEVCRLREIKKIEQQVHESRQPCQLGYCLQTLHKFEVNNDRFCQWKSMITSGSAIGQSRLKVEPSYGFNDRDEVSMPARNQDELVEIDQYFNFDDLNICEANGSD